MAYQVLARKWRPQRFDDVIGQRGVTETLRNAIASKRIAQSFVFAGPRGVGKTTTARILARALNCEKGPTADPCGVCDACVEIAEGRDIDVFEIDAATHTQVDKVREIIIAGLGMAPVRNRYKIFIIDEVHRLSQAAFDALLKSIEEPPPHVVFMMATTEIEKVPATIQSRSQVFELKTIGVKPIADQLRRIAEAEKIAIDDAALMLVARAGDGSMRDAQSALDQVIAFAGNTVTADDVTAVLGLVRRDLLIEMTDAVAREDASVVFDLAARAVEAGYDLRLVIRELSRLSRDLLVLTIDPSRVSDPEIAAEAERQALLDLAKQFSAEDLLRAFDVLTKAEVDIRASMQPRYHLEMALLRWIHLRKLVPLTDLIDQMQGGAPRPKPATRGEAKTGGRADDPERRRPRGRRSGGRSQAGGDRTGRHEGRAGQSRHRTAAGARSGGIEGSLSQRDPQVEEVLSRHRRGAGAADRRRAGALRVRLRSAASRAALAARTEPLVAGDDRQRARRTQDVRRLRRGRRRSAGVHVHVAVPARERPRSRPPGRLEAAGARRLRRSGAVGRFRGRDQRCRRNVGKPQPLARQRSPMNIQQMMKQAQQMQDRLQQQMAELRVEATAGGGMVTVVMNGAKQIQSLKIDPEAVSKDDVEMLQDLILAAINDAQRKADEALQKQMGGMMGGLKIPGLF